MSKKGGVPLRGKGGGKTYLIIGLGRFGSALSLRLAEAGAHVVAADKSRAKVDALSDRLEFVAQLDATDEASLLKVGAKDADVAVVCLGEKTEGSILVTAILKEIGVPYIISRANDELQARILGMVGAHRVISPETEIGRRLADTLETPWLNDFLSSEDEKFVTGKVPAQPEMLGKTLQDLALPAAYGATVLFIERNGKKVLPHAKTKILSDDQIWLLGEKERLLPLLHAITVQDATVEDSRR
jgi:K+ transport systems, NAD-binding component